MSISDSVEEVRDCLTEHLESLAPCNAPSNVDESFISNEVRTAVVHLPRIDIPKFAGDITQWENFRDMFDSLVSNKAELSNVQKLHYLKANLLGEASLVLSNIQVTDVNYNTAWELLKKRYDNPRAFVSAHLQAFVDIPSVSSFSVSDLKFLRDKTSDIYTALLNLKRPVNLWEDLLIFITVSKLDKSIRHDWELSLGDNTDLPNFAELDGFLSSRIRALEAIKSTNSTAGKADKNKTNKAKSVKSHQASARA